MIHGLDTKSVVSSLLLIQGSLAQLGNLMLSQMISSQEILALKYHIV